jgi:hypothetical protein
MIANARGRIPSSTSGGSCSASAESEIASSGRLWYRHKSPPPHQPPPQMDFDNSNAITTIVDNRVFKPSLYLNYLERNVHVWTLISQAVKDMEQIPCLVAGEVSHY